MTDESTQLIEKLSKSKSYKGLCPAVVERIVREMLLKYRSSEADKKARNYLHQIWGAYFTSRPNFSKLMTKLTKDDEAARFETIRNWLNIHASTKERFSYFEQLYTDIYNWSDAPRTFIDLGSGFSPLAALMLPTYRTLRYIAYDIDAEQASFFNEVFTLFGINFSAECGDLICDEFTAADTALLLKVVPLLETQRKGSTIALIDRLEVKSIAITFPKRSLGGYDKGMVESYKRWFDENLAPSYSDYRYVEYPNELLFLVKK